MVAKCSTYFIPWGGGGEQTEMTLLMSISTCWRGLWPHRYEHLRNYIALIRTYCFWFGGRGVGNSIADTSETGFRMGLSIVISLSPKTSSNFVFVINGWWERLAPLPISCVSACVLVYNKNRAKIFIWIPFSICVHEKQRISNAKILLNSSWLN